ncbi:MAG: hypothetical protein L6R00_21215, partial [Phycisphaerae bacterium]|nr:hypothetical protein [Phycisphaerae bacterium]
MDSVATGRGEWEEEKLLLDVGGEVVEVHDLRHARLGDVRKAGQFGLIRDFANADEPIEVDRQGHQTGHTGDAAWLDGRGARVCVSHDQSPVFPPKQMHLAPDFDHAASSTPCCSSMPGFASDL